MSTKAIEALEEADAKALAAEVQLRANVQWYRDRGRTKLANDTEKIRKAVELSMEAIATALTSLISSPPAPSELVEAGEAMAELLEGPWFHYEENRDKVVAAWRKAKVSQTSPWISVETRLPEPYTWVLVFSDTSETGDFQFDIGRVIGGEWKCLGWDYPVTHWMPLPPTPEQR